MRVPGTANFYGRYLEADLAISMRVHSMSPCIGLGVPMIPLVTQPRMWDFLAHAGLSDLALDAFSRDLGSQLAQLCLKALEYPVERRERFLKARTKMRDEARVINSRLFELFN
jgi:polysaccharide pyruvyl transferase WcaK-like protein